MWEFEMFNINTEETRFAYGFSLSDVREKHPEYENSSWVCLTSTYVD